MLLLVMPGPHGLHASLCRSSYTRSQEGVMLEALELQILKLVRGTTTHIHIPGYLLLPLLYWFYLPRGQQFRLIAEPASTEPRQIKLWSGNKSSESPHGGLA